MVMTVPNTCPTDPLAVPWNSGWEIPCGVRSPTLPAAGAASLQIPRRAMTPPQIPSKTSRQIERQVVYEKSRSGQSVGHGKRHVPVLDPEPSWKVGRFTGPDRPHRVGLAPTVGFRFMSYCRNSSRIVAALRASIARNTRAISATRTRGRGRVPGIAKGDRERDAGGRYGPVGRRIKSRAPDLAAIISPRYRWASMPSSAPLNGGSGTGLTVVLMSFPPVKFVDARELAGWR
jgi:hypothetical protein